MLNPFTVNKYFVRSLDYVTAENKTFIVFWSVYHLIIESRSHDVTSVPLASVTTGVNMDGAQKMSGAM